MTDKPAFPVRPAAFGLVVFSFGWVAVQVPGAELVGTAALVTGPAIAAVGILLWIRSRRGTSATIGRWSRRSRRHDGVASMWDHMRVSSKGAMRRRSVVLRPSLGALSRWQRFRLPVTEYATPLARAGWHTVYSPCEDVTLRVGGPRTGKTGELAGRIVDAPGAVLATSTRTDLVELTAAARAAAGPIHVFNPSGLGGWASTIKWSPLIGCRSSAVAQRRAADMIPTARSSEGERWDVQARRTLALLLHAAALADLPMRAVLAWTADPNAENGRRVAAALESSQDAKALQLAAAQFFGLNDRTKTSITATIMPAIGWLTDSRAAAVGDAQGAELLDVAELLDQRGTVYLLGAEDGVVAPLVAALTAEIAHQARGLAALMPGGRLDPPLTIALDEAALVCPVPLDRWTADMGGRNITIHVSIQSRAQMRQRWGDAGAATILNNTATILVYGGTRDPDDLAAWSTLSGEREEVVETRDADGKVTSTSTRRVPVLSQSQVANLPAGHVMIVRRGMPVSVGRTVMGWKRRDIRRANRRTPFRPVTETSYADSLAEDAAAEGGE